MAEPTWKAVWAEIENSQMYDDGVELGLRLLQATRQHRARLTPRTYASSRIRLYGRILTMLDRAERWDAYLLAWDAMLMQTDLCLSLKGEAVADNPALGPLVRRADGGLGAAAVVYGVARPAKVDVHFLHTHLTRKAFAARRLAEEHKRTPSVQDASQRPPALMANEIHQRLVQVGGPTNEP
jgi:hypothetical protein